MDIVSIVACICSILGKICVNHKWKINFVFFIAGYVFWIAFNIINTPNVPQIVMYVVYTILSIDGWIKWSKEDKMSIVNEIKDIYVHGNHNIEDDGTIKPVILCRDCVYFSDALQYPALTRSECSMYMREAAPLTLHSYCSFAKEKEED